MGRPTNQSKETTNYLKEQCQLMESALNQLESICKQFNIFYYFYLIVTIGLLVGKLSVRFMNIENELNLFDD